MDLGLKGRVAIVTGGSDGIGKAAALSLAKEGARVAICARRSEVLDAAAVQIKEATAADLLAFQCDVRDESQVSQFVEKVMAEWGRIDILVNNAGTGNANRFEDVDNDLWEEDLQVKVYGAIYFSRAVLPHMMQASWGRIINITTPGGKLPHSASLPTSLSRAAGIALTKAMSKDYAPNGILINTICIGLIKSGQHERRWERVSTKDPSITLENFYEKMAEQIPLGRVGEASEAGDLICFLASDKASFISGTAINVDGGMAPTV